MRLPGLRTRQSQTGTDLRPPMASAAAGAVPHSRAHNVAQDGEGPWLPRTARPSLAAANEDPRASEARRPRMSPYRRPRPSAECTVGRACSVPIGHTGQGSPAPPGPPKGRQDLRVGVAASTARPPPAPPRCAAPLQLSRGAARVATEGLRCPPTSAAAARGEQHSGRPPLARAAGSLPPARRQHRRSPPTKRRPHSLACSRRHPPSHADDRISARPSLNAARQLTAGPLRLHQRSQIPGSPPGRHGFPVGVIGSNTQEENGVPGPSG